MSYPRALRRPHARSLGNGFIDFDIQNDLNASLGGKRLPASGIIHGRLKEQLIPMMF